MLNTLEVRKIVREEMKRLNVEYIYTWTDPQNWTSGMSDKRYVSWYVVQGSRAALCDAVNKRMGYTLLRAAEERYVRATAVLA